VQIRPLAVPGAFEVTPVPWADDRGVFLELYRHERLAEAVGHSLDLRQANMSVSARGVVRGIHYADVPPSQAKYVTAAHGAVIDYVVDLRVGSPTFGRWDSVLLDTVDRRAIYLAEGLGHAFVALEDLSTVVYMVSEVYNPSGEHGVTPLDPEIALDLPFAADELRLSPKDLEAPSLADAAARGLLPSWEASLALYRELDGATA